VSATPVSAPVESVPADMAAQPDAERIRLIYADRWIGFPRAEWGLNLLRDLIQHPPCARMPCLLIHGDSGMGKTKIVERFRRDFPDEFDNEAGRVQRPVIVMEMPPGPGEQRFYGQLLTVVNAPHHGYERLDVLEQIALRLLRAIQPRMMIIDEVHNLLAGSSREQRRTLNLLKFLANQLRIPLVCLGTDDALRAMQSDPQIASRFEPFHLPRWRADEAFRSLLATLEATLPLRKPSNLEQKSRVECILAHSGGITGYYADSCSCRARHERDHLDLRIMPSKGGERIRGGDSMRFYPA
jgi:Bacterial TniB protein